MDQLIVFLGISITECLDLVKEAIDRAGYNGRIKMAIDVGATDFCIGKCNARNLVPFYLFKFQIWHVNFAQCFLLSEITAS